MHILLTFSLLVEKCSKVALNIPESHILESHYVLTIRNLITTLIQNGLTSKFTTTKSSDN